MYCSNDLGKSFKMLFVTKPDIMCTPWFLRAYKFPKTKRHRWELYASPKFRFDPKPKDKFHCHPYHLMEICEPLVNKVCRYHQRL